MWKLFQSLSGAITAASAGCGHVLSGGVVEWGGVALRTNTSSTCRSYHSLRCLLQELRVVFTQTSSKSAAEFSNCIPAPWHPLQTVSRQLHMQQQLPRTHACARHDVHCWPLRAMSYPSAAQHVVAAACQHRTPALVRACATAAGGKINRKQPTSAADLAMYLGSAVIAVIGLSYAMVPLYRLFCVATGYGGTLAGSDTVESKIKKRLTNPNPELENRAAQREVTVWFNADVADDMPWAFKPTQECVRIKAGQSALAFFTAQNKSDKAVTGYSLYNVTPDKAAQYFNKIQCFCFEEQRLRAGEMVDMPVFFYIDPEFVADWNCRNIQDITLSYVFHKVDDADLEDDTDDSTATSGVKLHGAGLEDLPPGIAPPVVPAATMAMSMPRYQRATAAASTQQA